MMLVDPANLLSPYTFSLVLSEKGLAEDRVTEIISKF